MKNNEELLVTIYCLTYNHKNYIREAFESFLSQNVKFRLQVFVYDDASTDGTSEIVKEYAEKYPEIFDVYISPINTYKLPERNKLMDDLERKYIKGKYVAFCEGDDYWIDDNKLQLQVDFLEKNPECSMTAHGAIIDDYNIGEKYKKEVYHGNRYLLPQEIIMQPNGNLPTASLVMRREAFFKDKDFPNCDVGDISSQLFALCKGKIYYFDCIMSVYRHMHEGSWTNNYNKNLLMSATHNINFVVFLSKYNEFTKKVYHEYIYIKMKKCCNAVIGALVYMEDEIEKQKMITLIHSQRHRIFKELTRIYKTYFVDNTFSPKEVEIIQNFKYVYIMGKGKYSKIIEKCFESSNLSFQGYLVSEKTDKDINTFALNHYPYDKKDTLVIVGIDQKYEEEIRKKIEENKFENIIYPLWF